MAKKPAKKETNEGAKEEKQAKSKIGIDVLNMPEKTCNDKKCPFHGNLKVHGAIIVGKVISSKASKTVTISYIYNAYIPKYERYEKKYTKVKAHNPECIDAKEGDTVRIIETRPLSKTKNFTVVEKIKQ